MSQATAASKTPTKRQLPFVEFVALMALMMSLVALSIDAMLPALPEIGQELGVRQENDRQLILSALFLGMAIGQVAYGPLSDSAGRKPAIYAGLAIYLAGCLLALTATNFQVMLAGRFVQGLGIAGPRSLAVAVVRDQYSGRLMARVMSFVMAVFILVPIVAPTVGQAIMLVASWRAIFGLFMVLATTMLLWFGIRQPETLAPERRTPFTVARIAGAFREVFSSRVAFGYTITAGLVSGAFLGFLNSAQQIFQDQYSVGTRFPLFFATLAIGSGMGSLLNGRLVLRFGMRALSSRALLFMFGLNTLFLLFSLGMAGHPPFTLFVASFMLTFFTVGILFGNLNALAMVPLGHIAGVGAAVVGSMSTLISTPLGAFVGQAFNGTVLPLVGGYVFLSAIAIVVMRWADSGTSIDSEPVT